MRTRTMMAVLAAALFAVTSAGAQSFGFGDASSEAAGDASAAQESGTLGIVSASATGARVGGSIEFSASAFFSDFSDAADASLANGSVGRLDFEAKGSRAEAAFKLKISDAILSDDPGKLIDEAYVRLFVGPAMIEGGLLKATWGKADSQSVLDVLNPLDLTDLSITDTMERKIAQPMLRVSSSMGLASKIEVALMPSFTPNSVAWEGVWMPAQIGTYKTLLDITSLEDAEGKIAFPDTSTLEYAQGGARLTTTIGSVDLGAQYFYGFLPTFAVSPVDVSSYLTSPLLYDVDDSTNPSAIPVSYNRYHQIGFDAATELLGLNWRAEIGANVTEDLAGDDAAVYNPAIVWNIGFDRDLFSGISLNLQGSGSVRLFDDEVSANGSSDLENDTEATKTKITAYLTQKLFKETVEWKIAGIWGIEEKDFFLYPSLGYIVGDARIDLSVGVFGGSADGELGQFADSSYAKLSLSYSF